MAMHYVSNAYTYVGTIDIVDSENGVYCCDMSYACYTVYGSCSETYLSIFNVNNILYSTPKDASFHKYVRILLSIVIWSFLFSLHLKLQATYFFQ